ncbi:mediator complex subunit 29 domain-containing protein [Ditylenchus destructor]|nr:mediator complex subunit 29 domain-containing protein [Ditylenchus destructor]
MHYYNPNQPQQPIRPPPQMRSNTGQGPPQPNQPGAPGGMGPQATMGVGGSSPAVMSRSPIQPGGNRPQGPQQGRPASQDNPFSPQSGMYHHAMPSNQQTLTPMSQQQPMSHQSQTPMSHHSSQNPLSNAPATPATPQQQSQQYPHGGSQQPGSAQHGPASAQSSIYTSHDLGSVGPPTGMHPGSVTSQHTSATASSAHQQFMPQGIDPMAAAKNLMLKDLRKAINDANHAAERITDKLFTSPMEEKKINAPQSVTNPMSVNPQSVNAPQSVNPPNSVKSVDEKSSVIEDGGNPTDTYNGAMNHFLNVCDEIEKNLSTVMETYRQYTKFDVACSARTPADVPNSTYPQLIQPYMDLMLDDKKNLNHAVEEIARLQEKMRTASAKGKAIPPKDCQKTNDTQSVQNPGLGRMDLDSSEIKVEPYV